jgi:nucleotide-binding universal stress UspA family protein
MFKHILAPLDGSTPSAHALQQILRFAQDQQAKLTGVHITAPFRLLAVEQVMADDTSESYAQEMEKRAMSILQPLEQAAKEANVPCEIVHAINDDTYDAIIRTASEKGCDLIAMASHGRRGMKGILLGSETQKVLTHSAIPVLVFR